MLERIKTVIRNVKWLLGGGMREQLHQSRVRLRRIEDLLQNLTTRMEAIDRHQRSRGTVYGHQMFFDPDDTVVSKQLSERGGFEAFETEVLRDAIRPGDTVLDIGANIGYYTLQFAQLVGDEGRVFAFEPDPRNFELLQRNVRQNRYQNVTLVHAAATSSAKTVRLYQNAINRGDHRTYDSSEGRQWVDVDGVVLDEFFANVDGTIDFIKMDIQGSEASALGGMKTLLQKNPGVQLVTEFWPRGLHLSGDEPRAFLQTLLDVGFEIQVIEDAAEQLVPLDVDQLLEQLPIERDTDLLFTNLLCRRPAAKQAAA